MTQETAALRDSSPAMSVRGHEREAREIAALVARGANLMEAIRAIKERRAA
jgi:hypothetical protein